MKEADDGRKGGEKGNVKPGGKGVKEGAPWAGPRSDRFWGTEEEFELGLAAGQEDEDVQPPE